MARLDVHGCFISMASLRDYLHETFSELTNENSTIAKNAGTVLYVAKNNKLVTFRGFRTATWMSPEEVYSNESFRDFLETLKEI